MIGVVCSHLPPGGGAVVAWRARFRRAAVVALLAAGVERVVVSASGSAEHQVPLYPRCLWRHRGRAPIAQTDHLRRTLEEIADGGVAGGGPAARVLCCGDDDEVDPGIVAAYAAQVRAAPPGLSLGCRRVDVYHDMYDPDGKLLEPILSSSADDFGGLSFTVKKGLDALEVAVRQGDVPLRLALEARGNFAVHPGRLYRSRVWRAFGAADCYSPP